MKIQRNPWRENDLLPMDELYQELTIEKLEERAWGSVGSTVRNYQTLFGVEWSEDQPDLEAGRAQQVAGVVMTSAAKKWKMESVSHEADGIAGDRNENSGGINETHKSDDKNQREFRVEAEDSVAAAALDTDVARDEDNNVRVDRRGRAASKKEAPKRRKILVKGEPGMGKTTWVKKVAYDWAMRRFTVFNIVLLVMLKLVRPGEAIESVIIKQEHNGWIRGLNVSEGAVRRVLETYGDQCLLILDGLDEHTAGENRDVMDIFNNAKLLTCNILVTSRPHRADPLGHHFGSIVRINGFAEEQALQFATRILKDENMAREVVRFQPTVDHERLSQSPILLAFLCVLVKNDPSLDLTDETINKGYIYMRMIRCVYKKYTQKKGVSYDDSAFVEMLRRVGKVAWTTLISGDPLMRKGDIEKDVGADAFDIGLLIGHEDARLSADETADVVVTWPHRSVQEFLASVHFVSRLDEGDNLQDLLGSGDGYEILLDNVLFFQFVRWLLNPSTDNSVMQIKQRGTVLDQLTSHIAALVDVSRLDLDDDLFPVLEELISQGTFETCLWTTILNKLTRTQHVYFPTTTAADVVRQIMCAIQQTHHQLQSVNFWFRSTDQDELEYVRVIGANKAQLDALLDALQLSNRQVHVGKDCKIDTDVLARPNARSVMVSCDNEKELFQHEWPSLQYLECYRLGVEELEALGSAVERGLLPCLESLKVTRCIFDEDVFCRYTWRGLRHVSCWGEAPRVLKAENFPSLETVTWQLFKIRIDKWEDMNEITLCRPEELKAEGAFSFLFMFMCTHSSRLVEFDLSENQWSKFLREFPVLPCLAKLTFGLLDDRGGRLVARASAEGRLPALKHMSLKALCNISSLFEFCTWNQLLSLNVFDTVKTSVFPVLWSKAESGCLESLQELTVGRISEKPQRKHHGGIGPFPRLRKLSIDKCLNEHNLQLLVEMVEEDYFPALRTLCCPDITTDALLAEIRVKRNLLRKGVGFYI